MTNIKVKSKSDKVTHGSHILHAILEELRALRQELHLIFPQEDLEGYMHPDRIIKSYHKAIEQYPPLEAWK